MLSQRDRHSQSHRTRQHCAIHVRFQWCPQFVFGDRIVSISFAKRNARGASHHHRNRVPLLSPRNSERHPLFASTENRPSWFEAVECISGTKHECENRWFWFCDAHHRSVRLLVCQMRNGELFLARTGEENRLSIRGGCVVHWRHHVLFAGGQSTIRRRNHGPSTRQNRSVRICVSEFMININLIFSDRAMGIFSIPTGLSSEATHMIGELLQEDQHRRPTADQCSRLDFFHGFLLPKSLPAYCLLREPRHEDIPLDDGKQLASIASATGFILISYFLQTKISTISPNQAIEYDSVFIPCLAHAKNEIGTISMCYVNIWPKRPLRERSVIFQKQAKKSPVGFKYRISLSLFFDQIRHSQLDEITEDRLARSKIWVTKWMYERHSGSSFAYQLSDNSYGIMFDDKTKFIKLSGAT